MSLQIVPPHPVLQDLILCFYVIDIDDDNFNQIKSFQPTGHTFLIFKYGKPYQSNTFYNGIDLGGPRCFLSGQVVHPIMTHFAGSVKLVGVFFKGNSFHRFFNIKMSELAHSAWDGEIVIGNEMTHLANSIIEQDGCMARINILQDYFIKKMQTQKINRRILHIENVVSLINNKMGMVKMKDICDYFNVSGRFLERHFEGQIGISPKSFSSIIQFNNMLKFMSENKYFDWPHLAHIMGYYDQQHLINSFKKYTCLTPTEYIKVNNLYTEVYIKNY